MGKCISLSFYLIAFSLGVCIYKQHFFDILRNQISNRKYLLELSKEDQSSSKYYVTCKDLKFWPKITFSKNYEPITVWLRFVYKITIFVGFIQTQKSYPTSFDKVITPWEISQFRPETLVDIISESCKTHSRTCVI